MSNSIYIADLFNIKIIVSSNKIGCRNPMRMAQSIKIFINF